MARWGSILNSTTWNDTNAEVYCNQDVRFQLFIDGGFPCPYAQDGATCKGNSIEASGDAWGAFAVRIFPSASSVVIELVTDGG